MLSSFNKYIILIALIVLIVSLTLYTGGIYMSRNNYTYPPFTAKCPDYWDISSNNQNTVCLWNKINPDNISTIETNKPDQLSISQYDISYTSNLLENSSDFKCKLTKWAKQYNISWDGITNSSLNITKYCN
jgi:hypothetical protein